MMKKIPDAIIKSLFPVMMLIVVSIACNYQTKNSSNLPVENSSNLVLDLRAKDGSVSGSYSSSDDSGDLEVYFSVTADGLATYHLKDAPESETLIVDLSDEQTARLDWKGTTLDGLGRLTEGEQSALEDLMRGDLAYGLEMIPLDIACQSDENIDPKQVAALLVPLQMRFKYLITERWAESQALVALSQCAYGGDGQGERATFIMLSQASPVPVVLSYFPFDVDGAVESPETASAGSKTACLAASPSMTADEPISFNLLGSRTETASGSGDSAMGPCSARCRGACGADCEPNNCKESKELRCVKHDDGRNTGMMVQYLIYDCGLHQGCIDHDNCYDQCNAQLGCNTWSAAVCRHAWTIDTVLAIAHPDWWCDEKAIAEHGPIYPVLWMEGYGPQPMRETFEYLDEEYEPIYSSDCSDLEGFEPYDPAMSPDDFGPPELPDIDICTLLPVHADMVTMPAEDSCVAEFDSFVDCERCGCTISITRMADAESAQQAAVAGSCANPKFYQRGDSPIGFNGHTCTNITGEEYREGVAQSYFNLDFSYNRYLVYIGTGYPGLEDFVISLGEQTIELIDDYLDQ
ncbi:MAG: hypothetical protein JXA42_04535 [Anaerolineales bacterium]|nr:hypothetical protein [Anaerolineales bacterium]